MLRVLVNTQHTVFNEAMHIFFNYPGFGLIIIILILSYGIDLVSFYDFDI